MFAGVIFSNHSASKGAGAIDVWRSKVTLFHCTFNDNTASPSPFNADMDGWGEQCGGAVRIQGRSSEIDFDSCKFNRNWAINGGAVYAGLGSGILFTACTFDANIAR